ncbi:MAG: two-component system nitrogen regulation sensor histidine kinase NtrY [Phenylobacterium sp.]|jgi:two-component system nitrogen regulation sensor histidine kinase NtrY
MTSRSTLPFERKLLLLSLISSLPCAVALIILMFNSELSVYLTIMAAIILAIVIAYCTYSISSKTDYLFRTLSNLLEAMATGDYSLKGRNELTTSALGDLVKQINTLSDTLANQRLEVKEHQLLLAKIIRQIDVAIIAIDGHQHISLANPAAAKLFNLNVEQLTGMDSATLALPDFIDSLTTAPESSPEAKVIQWSFPLRSGKFSVYRDQYIEGGQSHQLLFITDVRDLLRREERKTWQNLIRVLSHEINNSLTPISSLSQTLKRMVEHSDGFNNNSNGDDNNNSEDKSDLQDGLHIIHERANSLRTFIDSYRQLSRLPEPDKQVVNISGLIHNVISFYEHREIVLNCPVQLQATLDPVQFEQLLINLIKNADEAMTSPQGEITIDCAINSNDNLVIKIKDQGSGLNNPDNLFVPFYTTKAKGSGIGLVLARQIVEAHQGDLLLANRVDSPGCEVIVQVPC